MMPDVSTRLSRTASDTTEVKRVSSKPLRRSRTSRSSGVQEKMEGITEGVARMFPKRKSVATSEKSCASEHSVAKQKLHKETLRGVREFKKAVHKDDPESPEQILRSLFKLALTRRNAGQHRMTRGVLVLSEDTHALQESMKAMAKLGRERRLNGQHRLASGGRRLVHTQVA